MQFKIRHNITSYVGLLILGIWVSSCGDRVTGFSDIPKIKLRYTQVLPGVLGTDSVLIVNFSYEDGDGDIGLTAADTFPPYNPGSPYQYNLLVDVFEYTNGGFKPVLRPGGDTLDFNQRIPDLRPTGKIKEISGDITVRFDAGPLILYPDTVMCRITIVDRALHLSNTIETGLVPLQH